MSLRVLIADPVHPSLMSKLHPLEVDHRPDILADELFEILPNYHILIIRSKVVLKQDWIDRGARLRLIARYGSGMDAIDVAYAESKGIECINAPEGNRVAVAEQTMAMLLSLLSDLPASSREVGERIWNRKAHIGLQLSHRTVGIIGFGNTGSALAERLLGFGCTILAHDRFKTGFGMPGVEEVGLDRILEDCDVISLHVDLNPSSHRMVDSSFISRLGRPVVLLNLSRGEVVDTQAVCQAIRSGRIHAAGLDVFEQENMAQLTDEQADMLDFLCHHPRVIVSPHTGGLSQESEQMLAEWIAIKIKRFTGG